jgi:S1-C subfamily serine protease
MQSRSERNPTCATRIFSIWAWFLLPIITAVIAQYVGALITEDARFDPRRNPQDQQPAPPLTEDIISPSTPVRSNTGMLINAIEPNSPVDNAGFPIDGWLISLDGVPINSVETARSVAQQNQGTPIVAVIQYNGETFELEVTPSTESPRLGVDLCLPERVPKCRGDR